MPDAVAPVRSRKTPSVEVLETVASVRRRGRTRIARLSRSRRLRAHVAARFCQGFDSFRRCAEEMRLALRGARRVAGAHPVFIEVVAFQAHARTTQVQADALSYKRTEELATREREIPDRRQAARGRVFTGPTFD
jgi:hypothetical protein